MPVVVAERFEQAGACYSGIVDHHIEPAPAPGHALHGVAQVFLLTHVAKREHAVHTLFGQTLTGILAAFLMDVSDRHAEAMGASLARQRQTEAAGAAGDQYGTCLSQLRSPGLVDKSESVPQRGLTGQARPGQKYLCTCVD